MILTAGNIFRTRLAHSDSVEPGKGNALRTYEMGKSH